MNILWIQGWSIPLNLWKKMIEPLQKEGSHHVFVDFSSCENKEDFLYRVLEKIDRADNWLVAGWSMGAMLALEAALQRPDRIKRLQLVSASVQFVQGAENPSGMPSTIVRHLARQVKRNREAALEHFYSLMFTKREMEEGWDKRFIEQYEQMNESKPNAWSSKSLIAGLDYLSHLKLELEKQLQLRIPIRWLHGTEDQICAYPLLDSSRIAALQVHPINGAGHVPFFTQLPEVKRIWEEVYPS